MSVLLILAVLILLVNLYVTLDIFLGAWKMRNLEDINQLPEQEQPSVSIIVPACNEEDTIEPALRSLLSLEYANLEIIVINDRSTDCTGEVLQKIQEEHSQLRIIDIPELPEGWLGKNHAMHQGAMVARGDYLLFTDADILFDRTTVARAMSLMVREKLDHLSLIFKNISRGLLLNAMMVDAGGGLFAQLKPWKVRDPKNKNFIGVGAFNLVKRSVYTQVGGHEGIKMHPIDDIMLGKIIKRNGYNQDCLLGYDFLQVNWYESPQKMIQGLMKNIFALYNYRVTYALAAIIVIFAGTILPVWGLIFTTGMSQLLFALIVSIRLFSAVMGCAHTGTTLWAAPFSLITPYIIIYIVFKGMVTNLSDKGINWRGTHYPLDKLRENESIIW